MLHLTPSHSDPIGQQIEHNNGRLFYNGQGVYLINAYLGYYHDNQFVILQLPYMKIGNNVAYFYNGQWYYKDGQSVDLRRNFIWTEIPGTIDDVTFSSESPDNPSNFFMYGHYLCDLLLHMQANCIEWSSLGITSIAYCNTRFPWQDILLDLTLPLAQIIADHAQTLVEGEYFNVHFDNYEGVKKYQKFLQTFDDMEKRKLNDLSSSNKPKQYVDNTNNLQSSYPEFQSSEFQSSKVNLSNVTFPPKVFPFFTENSNNQQATHLPYLPSGTNLPPREKFKLPISEKVSHSAPREDFALLEKPLTNIPFNAQGHEKEISQTPGLEFNTNFSSLKELSSTSTNAFSIKSSYSQHGSSSNFFKPVVNKNDEGLSSNTPNDSNFLFMSPSKRGNKG